MTNEEDNFWHYIIPHSQASRWDENRHRLNGQIALTDGLASSPAAPLGRWPGKPPGYWTIGDVETLDVTLPQGSSCSSFIKANCTKSRTHGDIQAVRSLS